LEEAVVNHRRCTEAGHHLVEAGLYDMAIDEMCSVEAVYANTRISQSHGYVYLQRVLQLHAVFGKMKSFTRSAALNKSDMNNASRWLEGRVAVINGFIDAHIKSMIEEDPNMDSEHADLLRRMFESKFSDVRKALDFHMLVDRNREGEYFDKYGEHAAEVRARLEKEYPLKMRSVVEHMTSLSRSVIQAFSVDVDNESQISSVAMQEQHNEELLAVLRSEQGEEQLDYHDFVSTRVADLQKDIDDLQRLRVARKQLMEEKKTAAFDLLRADGSLTDKATVQRFYLAHFNDVRKCRPFIAKYKLTDRSDPDRDALRAVLQEQFPTPVDTEVFPDRMVGLADNIVRGLGDHWVANEQLYRTIMESSGAPVLVEADKAAQKMLAAQVIVLQTENMGIPVKQLRKAEHFLYQAFKNASLTNNTKTLLRDKDVRTQINDEYPLADWLAVAREAEKRDRGPTMKRETSKVGKGGKTLVEHMDELCIKFTKISQDMGADAEDDINAVYKQRWHELHELSKVYKSYQGLCKELAAVDAWFANRDAVVGKCLEKAVIAIHDENPDLKEGLLSLIATIFEDKFADLKTTRELHGVLTSDPVFAHVGDPVRVRSALDQAFSEVQCADGLSGGERMLTMAVEVLEHFPSSDFAKEERFNSRKELLQSEKEEVEALFAKYRTFLRKMEMVHLWTGRRRDVLAFSIREEVHRIEDQMPHVPAKQLRSISAYLTDRLASLTKAHQMSDALKADSSSPMHVELLLELERQFPLKLSAEQLEQEEEMRAAFEERKMERAALRAQQEAEAATMAAALGNGDDNIDEAETGAATDYDCSAAAFSGGLDEPSILTMDGVESAVGGPAEVSPFAADAGASPFGAGEEDFDGASWLGDSEDGGGTHTDEATEEPDEWESPYKNYTMPARLERLLHRIFTRMDAVNDEHPGSTDLLTAREHAQELGAVEMESLEAAFRRYRNPRLEHLRKFEHYHRLLIREMSNMARDPLNGVYMACERQPYISEARKDFLALFSGYKRSKKMHNLAHVSNQDQVVPLYRSIGGLSHTFGPLVSMFNGHIGAVNSVAISSDESFVVSGGRDCTVKVWDSALGNVTFDLLGHEMEITSVCVSPDCSKVLSASLDGSVRLWDAAKGQILCISSREVEDNFTHATDPTAHDGHVYALAISPDGRHFVSGGEDGMLSLRELDTLRFITSVPHDTPVRSVCYTPDGTKIVSGSGVSERTFGAAGCDGDASSKGTKKKGDEEDIRRSRESKKSQSTQSSSSEKRRSGNKKGGGGGVAATAVASTTSSKKIRKVDGIGCVRVFDATSHTLSEDVARFEYFFGHVGSIAASDNMIVAAGSASKDTEFSSWNIKTREQLVFKGHDNKVTCVDISADGRRVVSGSWDDTARYWDASNASLIDMMEGHSGNVNQVCLAPSGSGLYTACQDEMVGVWDPTAVKIVKSSTSISEELHQVAVSHDGSTLVARTGTRSLILWSATSGKFLCKIRTAQPTTCVALSHDGMTVIAGQTDNCAHVWTRQASSPVATKAAFTLSGHTDEVLAVSCVGELIFTGSADCTMRSYEAATGNFKCAFTGHEGPVVAVAASPVRVETAEDFAQQNTTSSFFGPFSSFSSFSSSSLSSSSTGTGTGLSLSHPEEEGVIITPQMGVLGVIVTPREEEEEESKDAIQERPRSPSAYSIVGASGSPMSSKYRVRGGKAMPGEDSPHLPHKSPFKTDEPMEPIVVTASKDCTAIIWSLSGQKLQVCILL
jgi:WD40 repeat protein